MCALQTRDGTQNLPRHTKTVLLDEVQDGRASQSRPRYACCYLSVSRSWCPFSHIRPGISTAGSWNRRRAGEAPRRWLDSVGRAGLA
jgi:hypothetical protein